MTPAELRERRISAPTCTIKLLILTEIRLWDRLSWGDSKKENG